MSLSPRSAVLALVATNTTNLSLGVYPAPGETAGMDFEDLYRQHAGPLFALLASRVRPRTDAEDAAHEQWL